jgi:CRISPR-associated protein Csm1
MKMTDEEVKLVIGAILHDIGKVIYRQGDDRRKHSQSGYDFLKEEVDITDEEILNCVRYHHADMLKGAKIDKNSSAYIVYIADNIASAADRRQNDSDDVGFEISMPLQSVFNILNGNSKDMAYEPKTLDIADNINYPTGEKRKFDERFYSKIKSNIQDNLRGLEFNQEYVNSLLEVMEGNLSYVPSSTSKGEMADISLFDHVKLTAAVASCIYQYLQENNIKDFETALFKNAQSFYDEKEFILYSMDISGIQDFIYTIPSANALKTLRARSFYLEIMMEHIIDSLLQNLHLSRANLIYCGGGHCYILAPNTDKCKQVIGEYMDSLNIWLTDTFQTALYVADGFSECSTNMLKNVPNESYAQIFNNISKMISDKKSHRYSYKDIIKLNSARNDDYTRECKVCKRISKVGEDGECDICSAIEKFSKNILYDKFFTVTLEKIEGALPLPNGYYLVADDEKSLTDKMQNDEYFVRAYGKNEMFTGKHISTKLWIGDYTTGKDAKSFALESQGINRIGILRADVDNLGHAFVSGFDNPQNGNRYVTLSRTATLSRQLSMFFKFHINKILSNPEYTINGDKHAKRNVTICYSGGDDIFIVGAWNEVIEASVDIRRSFEKFTQGTLTLSAGIGVYQSGYPISAIAREVAQLEDASKKLEGKNAVTIFPDGEYHYKNDKKINDATYSWKEFEKYVIDEKYNALCQFFGVSDDRGKNFMYHLLELIRNKNEKIYFARYVYLLARLEPDKDAPIEQKENYKVFSEKMYKWYLDDNDSRQLKTAMNMYAYMTRIEEDMSDENK